MFSAVSSSAFRVCCPLVVAAGMACSVQAQCNVYRTDIPDFDQKRASAPGLVGLPNNGHAHCVPASWADNIAYLNDHGLPGLLLNQSYDWKDASSYNVAGTLIGYLGYLMGTDGGGTTNSVSGLKSFFNEREPGKLVGGGKGWSGGATPCAKDLYELMMCGGFGAVTRGFYTIPENTAQLVRTGGHIMAIRSAYDACSPHPLLGMRDPNTPSTESELVQSPFANYFEHLVKRTDTYLVDGILEQHTLWSWQETTTFTTIKIFDGFASVIPTVALTANAVGGVQPPVVGFVRPLNLTDPVHPTHGTSQLPPGSGVLRFVQVDPSLAWAWAVTETPSGGIGVFRIGMGTGTVETVVGNELLTLNGCGITHDGRVLIGSGRELRMLGLDAEGAATWMGSVVLTGSVRAVAEDDSTRQITVIQDMATGPAICRRPLDLALPNGPTQPCPPGVVFNGPTSLAVNPTTGEILCCSLNVASLFRLRQDAAGGWQLYQDITIPTGSHPANPTWGDNGTILFTNNGVVSELEETAAGGWQPKASSLYAGMNVGPIFALATTRPAAEHASPADGNARNIADEQLRGNPDCSADFNGDFDVGTDADIEAFFACLAGNCCATCLSADFNGDGDVGTDGDIEAFFRVLGGGAC